MICMLDIKKTYDSIFSIRVDGCWSEMDELD